VRRQLDLSLPDLKARYRHRTETATLQCAGNRRAGLMAVRDIPGEDPWGPAATSTAEWTGVSLADVLADAGVDDRTAAHVAFAAPDVSQLAHPAQPFGGSVPLAKALAGEVLLAWEMNGALLPRVHGGPVRVVVPGYIGARSVKWVQQVTVAPRPSDNWFQAVAYRLLPPDADPDQTEPGDGLSLGSVALNSEIITPHDGTTVTAGPTQVTGYAFAGDDRTVARVDVSSDGGRSWVQADLDSPASPWSWQHWRTTVDLSAGPVEITARAWDTTGASQPESPAALWNPKGYVNTSWPRAHVVAR